MVAPEISAREAEVLAALGEHLTNAEIAARFVISVRTVESHVSALLRKFGASDRRALAALAPSVVSAGAAAPALPAALTSFVGREAERTALLSAVTERRLVVAVGPGGVGKTRLALAVAADVADRFSGGAWYTDLVPVPDGDAVPAAVAAALGLGEQPGRGVPETVAGWARGRSALLVLDNCEHLLDGVAGFVEPLLAAAPGLTVLATSRSRLLLPFEWVVPVGGLGADAVALFDERARAAGAPLPSESEPRVAAICAALDGNPLAIELAAARLPAVGLDGLESGLGDRLRLLDGARRGGGRHGSLRSALDWSHDLLDESGRTVLRRVSVFAAPFRASDAAVVAGGSAATLAALADDSLLVPVAGGDATRYQALETIRQYGAERLVEAGEDESVRVAHLRWCTDEGTALLAADPSAPGWRAQVDRLADDLHAALNWSVTHDASAAAETALLVGRLCHRRGLPAEAQRRFEQAAALAADDAGRAAALTLATGSARARLAGADALRLHLAAAEAAQRAGDSVLAAHQYAHAAELVHRSAGILAEVPPAATAAGWLATAQTLADDPGTLARCAVVEAFAAADDQPGTAAATEQAIELARESGDPVVESAALDQLTGLRLARGEARAALESALRRTALLAGSPDPEQGFELSDAYGMAAESAIAAGDLRQARQAAETLRDLPSQREVAHAGAARLIVVIVLAGDWDEAVAVGELFRESWERAGRPRIPSLRRVAAALASVHGAWGDAAAQAAWRDVEVGIGSAERRPHDQRSVESFFAALEALHLDRPADAVAVLHRPPEEFRSWFELIWRPWYAALWAEAAVLAELPDAGERIARARPFTTDNVVAAAIVDRAAALAAGDRDGVLAAAETLDAAACRYQWERSLLLAH
ncbi:LuxR C-terminal-related transcriptional regulator [Jiangella sp. DSM 45060]|uniref:ATP-binding protein n=1 Tax=Jiangella sp. DSM 45060 TaxID=1798224 RepID=UPI00087D0246|nr:LuxR C-terminal-related transcriptional regulator [Jiangella sp. DSM 45060]SDT71075.1 Predicted ATPase [Jiangella sp. DSM 45060]